MLPEGISNFKNLNHILNYLVVENGKYTEEYYIDDFAFYNKVDCIHRTAITFTAVKEKSLDEHIYPMQGYYRQTFGNEKLSQYNQSATEIKIRRIV